jgi:hypothetical protein
MTTNAVSTNRLRSSRPKDLPETLLAEVLDCPLKRGTVSGARVDGRSTQ